MPLDDLVSVIETLKQRIHEHGDSLRQNETRTRMALIDPLLTALGWNVADPARVIAEDIGNGELEYFLSESDSISPLVCLALRGLKDNAEPHRRHLLSSFEGSHDLYLAFTDGDEWELFAAIRPTTPTTRRAFRVSISQESAEQCAAKPRDAQRAKPA